MFLSRLCPIPSACPSTGITSYTSRASLAPYTAHPTAAACVPWSRPEPLLTLDCCSAPSLASNALTHAPTELQLQDIRKDVRAAVENIRKRVGTAGRQQRQLVQMSEQLLHAVGEAVQQFPWLDRAAMCAAVVAPFLVSDVLEHHELEDVLGQQAAAAAADVRLIIRAAEQFHTDALSLVEWSLQACSVQASLAAALFFLQHPGRSQVGDAFSRLLYSRLGQPLPNSPVSCRSSSNIGGREVAKSSSHFRPVVFMSSGSETESAPSAGASLTDPHRSEVWTVERADGSRGGREIMPSEVAPETPLRAADGMNGRKGGSQVEGEGGGERVEADRLSAGQVLAASKLAEIKAAARMGGGSSKRVQMQQSQDGSRPLLFRPGRRIIPEEEPVVQEVGVPEDDEQCAADVDAAAAAAAAAPAAAPTLVAPLISEANPEVDVDPEVAAAAAAAYLLSEELWVPPIKRPPPIPLELCPLETTRLHDLGGIPLPEFQPSVQGNDQAQKAGIRVPLLGPFFMSNFPKGFHYSDVVFNPGSSPDRLAVRLEYTMERGDPTAGSKLHVFNISRVFRKRKSAVAVFVNGEAMYPGDAGIQLCEGDELVIGQGDAAARFIVRPASGPISHVDHAIEKYSLAATGDPTSSAQQPRSPRPGGMQAGQQFGSGGTPSAEMEYLHLARLARHNPDAANEGFMRLAREQPKNTGVWLSWAQLAVRLDRGKMARDLFRAAAEVAGDPTVSPPGLPTIPTVSSRGRVLSAEDGLLTSSSSDDEEPNARLARFAAAAAAASSGKDQPIKEADRPLRSVDGSWNKPLMQVLFNWGRFEWSKRLFGPARHLWRRSADLALAHPDGWAAGGAGIVLHSWALAELQEDNVRNARIIVAEALRKCPEDQPLYVLAGSIELAGGNYDLAKAFCLRAYEMDRLDKHLYYVWPKIEAASGEPDRARVLFERGLEYHPKNTKIMHMYAQFEEEQGDMYAARELHDRALETDPVSATTLHNRASWASLEADEGNLQFARDLVEEGLEMHPDGPATVGIMVVLAKLNRLEGKLEDARQILDRASKFTSNFNTAIIKERALLFHSAGETALARNLAAHLSSVKRMTEMKRAGAWGWQAWREYFHEAGTPKRKSLAKAAHARKRELGIWDDPGKPGPVLRGERLGQPMKVKLGYWQPPRPPPQECEGEEYDEGEVAAVDEEDAEVAELQVKRREINGSRDEGGADAKAAAQLEEGYADEEAGAEDEMHMPMLHREL